MRAEDKVKNLKILTALNSPHENNTETARHRVLEIQCPLAAEDIKQKSRNASAQLRIIKNDIFTVASYSLSTKTHIIHSTNRYKTIYPPSSYNER
jgi:hypothetical protein